MNHLMNNGICSAGCETSLDRSYWSNAISLLRSTALVLAAMLSLFLCFPGVSSGEAIGFPDDGVTPADIQPIPRAEFTEGIPVHETGLNNVWVRDDTLMCRGVSNSELLHVKLLEAVGSDIYALGLPETEVTPESNLSSRQSARRDLTTLPDRMSYPPPITISDKTTMKNAITQAPATEPADEMSTERKGLSKWVWVGLGVVAVSALAGGGGRGGGNDNNVAPAGSNGSGNSGTGTVIITAPVPSP